MSEEEIIKDTDEVSRWSKHRFIIMIISTIVIAFILVGISMALYKSSGTVQLDFSRPGLQSVRSQATPAEKVDSFPTTGTLDKKAIKDFRTLFDTQLKQVVGVDSFGGDVMSDKSLGIDAPAVEPVQ